MQGVGLCELAAPPSRELSMGQTLKTESAAARVA
jgi:hypothetical protein